MKRLLFAIVLALLLSSCSAIKGLGGNIESGTKNLAEGVKESADKIALAMPGERYLRLIEDVRSNDASKAANAKKFVEDLFKVNLDRPYIASAWFEYPPDKAIHADIFRASIGEEVAVISVVASKALNLTSVANVITPVRTVESVRADVSADIKKALDQLIPKSTVAECPGFGGPGILNLTDGFLPVTVRLSKCGFGNGGGGIELFPTGGPTSPQAPALLTNALFRLYQTNLVPNGDQSLRLPWAPLDARQYLFVLIKGSDFERVKDSLKVRVLVHDEKNPSFALAMARAYEFRTEEFAKYSFSNPYNETVYWAAHNMNQALGISNDQIQMIRNLRMLLDQYEQTAKGSKNQK